jgi:hypothetical protein
MAGVVLSVASKISANTNKKESAQHLHLTSFCTGAHLPSLMICPMLRLNIHH